MRADSDRQLFGEPLLAWVTLGAGVIAVCAHSATSYSIPVLMKPILEDLGWTRGEFAATTVTRMLAIALSGLAWGILTDRIGARAVLAAGAALCAVGLVGFANVRGLAELYLVGGVMGLGIGALGPVAASTLITRRFGRRRGFALGLLHGGDNLLNSVVPLATAFLLAGYGWRGTTWIQAAAYAGLGLVLLLLLRPGEGRAEPRTDEACESGSRAGGLPWRRIELPLVSASFFVAYGFFGSVIYHLVAWQTDLGIDVAVASGTMGTVVLAGFFGALLVGALAERVSPTRMLVVVHLVLVASSIVLWAAPDAVSLRRWAWVHGFAQAGYAPLLALVIGEHFGMQHPRLGATIGLVSVVAMAGAYLGNLTCGLTHDATGSYRIAWTGFSAALAVTSLAVIGLARRRRIEGGRREGGRTSHDAGAWIVQPDRTKGGSHGSPGA